MTLAWATWPDVAEGELRALVVPVGSCEQHGPHLPFGTDTVIAEGLCATLLEARRDQLFVAPALSITASGEHAGFPGTLSIGTAVLTQVLVEIGRSADWARGVLFVNGHGGNAEAMRDALATLQREGRRVLAWWPPTVADGRADAHAGWTETSLLLHLSPLLVRDDLAVAGDPRSLGAIGGQLRAGGVIAVSPNGVLGDPADASAAAGAELFDAWSGDLVARFDEWVR